MAKFTWNWELVQADIQDTGFKVHRLAEKWNISKRQVERLFQRHTGQGAYVVISNLRLTKAAEGLCGSDSIKQVAYDLKFKHPSNFASAFKKQYGVSPTKYKAARASS